MSIIIYKPWLSRKVKIIDLEGGFWIRQVSFVLVLVFCMTLNTDYFGHGFELRAESQLRERLGLQRE